MAGLLGSAKELLSVKLKYRHDSHFDQYSRIGMVKLLMLSSVIVGLNWFSDKITCIVPGSVNLSGGFVSEACWIQGFYVHPGVSHRDGEVGYYGIPNDIDMDGKYANGKLCRVHPSGGGSDPLCIPMLKTFFLQYQYMPFFLAALCIFYYVPYMVMSVVNKDLKSLHDNVKGGTSADNILQTYFNSTLTKPKTLRMRVLVTLLVKLLYIVANIVGMVMCDKVLYGGFMGFGTLFTEWGGLPHEAQHDYTHTRSINYGPKPGNVMLPTFGICEVQESARDVRHTITNRHKFVCEYSQNILYHYVLLMLWYAFVFGILISCIGLLWKLVDYIATVVLVNKSEVGKKNKLTLREFEYLEYIRKRDFTKYGEVMDGLKLRSKVESEPKWNGSLPSGGE